MTRAAGLRDVLTPADEKGCSVDEALTAQAIEGHHPPDDAPVDPRGACTHEDRKWPAAAVIPAPIAYI